MTFGGWGWWALAFEGTGIIGIGAEGVNENGPGKRLRGPISAGRVCGGGAGRGS